MSSRQQIIDRLTGTGHLVLAPDGSVEEITEGALVLLAPGDRPLTCREDILELAEPWARPLLELLLVDEHVPAAPLARGERRLRLTASVAPEGRKIVAVRDVTEAHQRRQGLERLTALMRMAEHTTQLGHWHFELATGEVQWSDGTYAVHGLQANEVEPSFELVMSEFHPEDAAVLQAAVQRAIQDGTPYDLRLRLAGPASQGKVVRAHGLALQGPSGEVTALFGTIQDITEQERGRERERLLSEVVQSTAGPVIITDPAGLITWVNPAFEALTGYSFEEARGHKPGALLQGPQTDPETVAFMSERLRAREPFTTNLLNYSKNGSSHHIKLSVRPRLGSSGELLGFMAVQMDVSELQRAQTLLEQQGSELRQVVFKLERQNAEQQRLLGEIEKSRAALQRQVEARERLENELRRMAMFDTLTKVPNRRHLLGLLRTEASRSRRYAHPVSVLMLDIDHFKRINDTYGHAVGDEALVHLAAVVQRCLRDTDALGRTGGEEFVCVLPECDLLGAQAVAERVRRTVASTPVPSAEAGELPLSVSIGIAELHRGEGVDGLVMRADQAMYDAKRDGRNRWKVAPPPAGKARRAS